VKYFGAVMALIYFFAGGFFLLKGEALQLKYAVPFGILMIVYGAFRGFTVYQRFKSEE
jgi:hypothetical protein